MSVEPPATATSPDCPPINKTVSEFRGECRDLEDLVQCLLDELDHLFAEVEQKSRRLDAQRRRMAADRQEISALRAEMSDELGQLRSLVERQTDLLSKLLE